MFCFRTLVLNLVTKLVKSHGEISVPALSLSLHETFSSWPTIVPTKPNAKIALAALQWISVIVVNSVGYINSFIKNNFIIYITITFKPGNNELHGADNVFFVLTVKMYVRSKFSHLGS